jgi:hypothetical protein
MFIFYLIYSSILDYFVLPHTESHMCTACRTACGAVQRLLRRIDPVQLRCWPAFEGLLQELTQVSPQVTYCTAGSCRGVATVDPLRVRHG